MASPSPETTRSAGASALAGVAVGTGAVALYLAAGLLSGSWDVGEFLSYFSPEVAGWLLFAGALAVAVFALPVALYLYRRLRAPLAVLAAVLLFWVGYAALTGLLLTETVLGLALYAFGLAPLYVVLYLLSGAGEYYVRRRRTADR